MLSISAPGRKKYWITCVVDDHFGHPLLPGTKGTICLLDGKDSAQWGGPVSFPSRPCCWQSLGCCSLKDNDGKPGSVLALPFPGGHGDGEHWEGSWAGPGGQLDCAWASESPNSKVKGDIQRFLVSVFLLLDMVRGGGRQPFARESLALGLLPSGLWMLSLPPSLSHFYCACVHTLLSLCICVFTFVCVCACTCVCLCVYVCYVCVHVYPCVCVCL